jgi:hypothetical protein
MYQRRDAFRWPSQVAHGRHPAPKHLLWLVEPDVHVRIDEARDQCAAARVDPLGIRRDLDIGRSSGRADRSALDHNGGVFGGG